MKTIHKDTDFNEGYKLTIENSLKHLQVAENCISVSYGIATAHLILAAEEAVKAFLFLQQTIDKESLNNVNPEDFEKYFSKHKFKHETIRQIEFFMTFLDMSTQISIEPFKDVEPGTLSRKSLEEKKNQGVDNLIKWLNNLIEDKESIDINENWWKQADSNKKKGFYINLLKKTGKWEGPHLIKKSFYLQSKDIVEKFINRVLNIEKVFNNEDIRNEYFEIKRKIKKK